MKKILIGFLALSLMSTAVYAGGGRKKANKKAKVECSKGCPDSKDCRKDAKCPNKPGCVCK